MTTRVSVTVPPGAHYDVLVFARDKLVDPRLAPVGATVMQETLLSLVLPGDHKEFYATSTRDILVREVPRS